MAWPSAIEFGAALIIEAAALAQRFYESQESLTVRSKGTQDVVSEADAEVEKLIRGAIEERFPEDAFFGEEFGHNEVEGAEAIWIVDPIDGTQPFLEELSLVVRVHRLRLRRRAGDGLPGGTRA